MLVITVYGLSENQSIRHLDGWLHTAALPNRSEIFFPIDLNKRDGKRLVCLVSGLIDEPKESSEQSIASSVAQMLGKFAEEHLPDCCSADVVVNCSHSGEGGSAYWTQYREDIIATQPLK